jgi:hypothetical protein
MMRSFVTERFTVPYRTLFCVFDLLVGNAVQ